MIVGSHVWYQTRLRKCSQMLGWTVQSPNPLPEYITDDCYGCGKAKRAQIGDRVPQIFCRGLSLSHDPPILIRPCRVMLMKDP